MKRSDPLKTAHCLRICQGRSRSIFSACVACLAQTIASETDVSSFNSRSAGSVVLTDSGVRHVLSLSLASLSHGFAMTNSKRNVSLADPSNSQIRLVPPTLLTSERTLSFVACARKRRLSPFCDCLICQNASDFAPTTTHATLQTPHAKGPANDPGVSLPVRDLHRDQ